MSKLRLPAKLNPGLIVRVLLAVVVVICALVVGFGTRPWDTEVAAQHALKEVALVDDYMAYGFWYGFLFTGAAALVLLATSKWWLTFEKPEQVSVTIADERPVARRTFWMVLLGIVVVSAIPRVARLGQSFWGDEDWAYRDLIGGRFREAEDGSLMFRRHPWKVTAFWDKGTNNQYAYTLTARACHESWKRLSGAPPQQFEEWPLRLPSLLAGLGSIVMGALLLRRLGFSRAALFLAALLAIHPWHLRYSSEARGYTMLLFFLLAGIYFLIAALEDGRWRWWLAFAMCEFLALYTWKAAVHPVAALNVGVLGVLLVKRRGDFSQFGRWLVVNITVLMLFVPLFAPAIPQIQRKLAVSTQAQGKMGLSWFKDVTAQLAGGADWEVLHWGVLAIAVAGLVLLVVGIARMCQRLGWIVVAAPLAGAVLAFVHFSLTNNELLKWYVFYTLPFLLLFIAVGLEKARTLGFTLLAGYILITGGINWQRCTTPIQQSREAAEMTRNAEEGKLHMGPSDLVTVGLYRVSQSYDPRMRQGRDLRSGEALMEVVEECRAAGKRLHLSAANLKFARGAHADFFEVLGDASVFRKTGDFPAAENYLDIETYEMVPVVDSK